MQRIRIENPERQDNFDSDWDRLIESLEQIFPEIDCAVPHLITALLLIGKATDSTKDIVDAINEAYRVITQYEAAMRKPLN